MKAEELFGYVALWVQSSGQESLARRLGLADPSYIKKKVGVRYESRRVLVIGRGRD